MSGDAVPTSFPVQGDLKPCPCCGHKPAWLELSHFILCPNCGLQSITSSEEVAAAKWNRRSTPDTGERETILTELWNATHEETSKGPQAYGWGWVDAMQKIRLQIENHRARRGPGIVREVASKPEVNSARGERERALEVKK